MSSAAEQAPAPTAVGARRSRLPLVVIGLAIALLVPVLLAAAALYAWDAGYQGRILPGVRVGAVDLSGMDRGGAEAALREGFAYGDGRIVLQTPHGDIDIPYADVSRAVDAEALVDRALAAGREGTALERAVGQVRMALDGRSIEPRVTLDTDEVVQRIARALEPLDMEPVDATIAMSQGGSVVTGRARDGRTVDAAPVQEAALAALARVDAPAELVLKVPVRPVPPAVGDRAVSDARAAVGSIARPLAVGYGSHEWTISPGRIRTWLGFERGEDGTIAVVVDQAKIPGYFSSSIAKAVARTPRSAQYLVARSGKIVGVVESSTGRTLDKAATAAAVAAALEDRAGGGGADAVKIRMARVLPELGTDEAAKKAPVMSLLGTWKTWFPISERNYNGANIWLPAQLINGTVLRPGQTFDWWDAIWPVTPARGFGPGGIIRVDRTEPTGALGGGMCSSSTTLFNAAMRAGLDIGQRYNHRYYIDRYPLGLDATVSIIGGSRQSMTFRNDTKHAIFIRGTKIRNGAIGWVKYEIWGIPDGRTTSLSRPTVSNVRRATTREVLVDTRPTGVREQVEYPSDGMNVSVSRVVRDAAGRVLHRDTWVSRYVRWDGVVEVGR